MTSIPVVSSAMTAPSVRDAIASYRRAQYFLANSTLPSPFLDEDAYSQDEEADVGSVREPDEECFETSDTLDQTAPQNDFVNQLEWDEDLDASGPDTTRPRDPPVAASVPVMGYIAKRLNERKRAARPQPAIPSSLNPQWNIQRLQETTPLLIPKGPVSFDVPPRALSMSAKADQLDTTDSSQFAPHERRVSNVSVARSAKSNRSIKIVGQSTFGQTLFNSIAILLGIGMLSEPLAFAYAGWFMGTVLIITYGGLACYTAKILARIICSDPRLRTYTDIGRKAFGPRATVVISCMFCLELFAVSIVLVTLYADSLHTVIPTYSANTYKIWGLLLLLPTIFLPLSLLSYTSILGLLSTALIVVVVIVDGTFKKEAPGSFWDPADTNFGFTSMSKLGIAFGLFMAGFAGHVVVPSLVRDMIDPTEFDTMINWAFFVATVIYALIGYAGYLMYGNAVSDEISIDILNTPGFNPLLNQTALWMLVLNPLSKFALNTRPLMSTLEILLGLDPPETKKSSEDVIESQASHSRAALRKALSVIQRIGITCASVAVSIYIPQFSVMMAFLGSFSAFCLSIIGPIAAKVKLEGKCSIFDASMMFMGGVMAVWGTIAAFK